MPKYYFEQTSNYFWNKKNPISRLFGQKVFSFYKKKWFGYNVLNRAMRLVIRVNEFQKGWGFPLSILHDTP
jgi:mRNA-degrading endonuclease HigB of HigAB toxin-antitoxin module